MYKHTLQMKIFLTDIATGEKTLVETKTTSPTAFFDHFPVHRSKITWTHETAQVLVTEMDLHKTKVYSAEITNKPHMGDLLPVLVNNLVNPRFR